MSSTTTVPKNRALAREWLAVRIIVITPHVESIKREFADAFDRWHREKFGVGAIVDYRNYGGATDIRKFFETSRATFDAATAPDVLTTPCGGCRPRTARCWSSASTAARP